MDRLLETTMAKALDILHQEHRAIMAVLHCLDHISDEVREGSLEPDFELFTAIIQYMQDYPDRFHHPKEDEYLFPAVAKKLPDLQKVIDELLDQHKDGARMLADMTWKLEDWQKAPKDAEKASAFLDLAKSYVDFQRRHAATEERSIMSPARKALDDGDWQKIDAAFTDNDDPMFGSRPQAAYNKLFSHIVALAPRPWGLAERHVPAAGSVNGNDAKMPESKDPESWSEDQRKALLNLHWV